MRTFKIILNTGQAHVRLAPETNHSPPAGKANVTKYLQVYRVIQKTSPSLRDIPNVAMSHVQKKRRSLAVMRTNRLYLFGAVWNKLKSSKWSSEDHFRFRVSQLFSSL